MASSEGPGQFILLLDGTGLSVRFPVLALAQIPVLTRPGFHHLSAIREDDQRQGLVCLPHVIFGLHQLRPQFPLRPTG